MSVDVTHSAHLKRCASPELLEDLVISVYATVWDRFYECDARYCQDAINSLAAGPSSQSAQSLDYNLDPEEQVSDVLDDFQNMSIDRSSSEITFSIKEFALDGALSTSSILVERIALQSTVAPVDPYEAYTPCPRNIEVGDDSDSLPFIPNADEPAFKSREYMEFFSHLSWQDKSFRDPDCTFYSLNL